MNAVYLDYYVGTWVNTSLYQIIQIGTGDGITFARPNVLYSGTVYRYIGEPTPSSTPGQYVTPNTDSNAVALYAIGGGSPVNVLTTPLTGFVATSGTVSPTSTVLSAFENLAHSVENLPILTQVLTGLSSAYGNVSATDTILSAFNKLTFSTNAVVNITPATAITATNLAITSVSASSNITVTTPNIVLPVSLKPTKVSVIIDVTSSATSGATFTLTGANGATVQGTSVVSVGASVTGQQLLLQSLVSTSTTLSPQLSIVTSAVTGTVDVNAGSTVIIGG